MRTDFLDFPTAWDIQREVGPSLPHDDLCSSVYSVAVSAADASDRSGPYPKASTVSEVTP